MVITELKKRIESIIGTHDARLLITGVLSVSNTDYMLNKDMVVSDKKATDLIDKAKSIFEGEPLQYAVGSTEFMSLEFKVAPGVLIPRQDTETLVEAVCKHIGTNKFSVLDIGTGSGCVAISIAHYCKNSHVTSADISIDAINIAKNNSQLNNTTVKFIECDIMQAYPSVKYDVIVSNPPYIPTSQISYLDKRVKDHEPISALDGGSDGLDFYRRIVSITPKILKPGGMIFFEVGYDQAKDVAHLMSKQFKNIKIIKDLCSVERVVCAQF